MERECKVCLRELHAAQRMVLVPCGHRLTCVSCTAKLLAQGMRCPVCRKEVSEACPAAQQRLQKFALSWH